MEASADLRSPKRKPPVCILTADRKSLDDSVISENTRAVPRASASLIGHHDDSSVGLRRSGSFLCSPGDQGPSSSLLQDVFENFGEGSEGTALCRRLTSRVVEETLTACSAGAEPREGEEGTSSGDEAGFFFRVSRSLKSLFNNCVNRPNSADSGQVTPRSKTPLSAHIHREQHYHHQGVFLSTSESRDSLPLSHLDVPMAAIHQASPAAQMITQVSSQHPQQLFMPTSVVIDLPPLIAKPILPELHADDFGKKCLVLDLDETLVHSSFVPVPDADYVLPLSLSLPTADSPHAPSYVQNIYVSKRPGVDVFLEKATKLFEVVIFTASLANYADPVINFLDPERRIRHRLYREDCMLMQGLYIKDLSRLGRPLSGTVIVDNSPASYLLQPDNAVAIKSWFNDPDDSELHKLIPPLISLASSASVEEWRLFQTTVRPQKLHAVPGPDQPALVI